MSDAPVKHVKGGAATKGSAVAAGDGAEGGAGGKRTRAAEADAHAANGVEVAEGGDASAKEPMWGLEDTVLLAKIGKLARPLAPWGCVVSAPAYSCFSLRSCAPLQGVDGRREPPQLLCQA